MKKKFRQKSVQKLHKKAHLFVLLLLFRVHI